jgi:hypothetical protein
MSPEEVTLIWPEPMSDVAIGGLDGFARMDSDTDPNGVWSGGGRVRCRFDDCEPAPDCLADGFEDDVEAVAFGSDLGSAEERHPPTHELAIVLEQLRRRGGTVALDKLGVPAQIREEEAAGRDACLVTLGCANLGFVWIHGAIFWISRSECNEPRTASAGMSVRRDFGHVGLILCFREQNLELCGRAGMSPEGRTEIAMELTSASS